MLKKLTQMTVKRLWETWGENESNCEIFTGMCSSTLLPSFSWMHGNACIN